MNLWINIALDGVIEAMKRVDIVVINDAEATMLAGTDNLVQAAKDVQSMASIPTLIIKKGEHGLLALHADQIIALPAYPTAVVGSNRLWRYLRRNIGCMSCPRGREDFTC